MERTDRADPAWFRVISGLAIAVLVIIVIALLGRFAGLLQPLAAFQVYFYGAQAGLALAAFGLLLQGYGLVRKNRPARRHGLIAVLAGLAPIATAVLLVGPSGFGAPMIHDISTDLAEPPGFVVARQLRTPGENPLDHGGEDITVVQRQAYPDIDTLRSDLAPPAALQHAADTAAALGWQVSGRNDDDGTLEAWDRTALFGFIDDIVIRVRGDGPGSRIDIRSVSRVGLGDVGKNAARIRAFRDRFQGPP